MANANEIQNVIIEQLSSREMGVLTLVVAVRRTLGQSQNMKGDLSAMVKSALRALIASKSVIDDDGTYSLNRAPRPKLSNQIG